MTVRWATVCRSARARRPAAERERLGIGVDEKADSRGLVCEKGCSSAMEAICGMLGCWACLMGFEACGLYAGHLGLVGCREKVV